MDIDLNNLTIDELKSLHRKMAESLEQALIKGCSWEEMHDHRKTVTELSVAIHRRQYPVDEMNPAEFLSRRNPEYPE